MEDQARPQAADTRSLHDVLAELRDGDFSQARVARLSDLSREDGRILARAWPDFPEATREAIVRRIDELSEERLDVNFRRALRVALDDPSATVRQLAVAALWEEDSTDLLCRFEELLETDPSGDVRAQAAAALEPYTARAAEGELPDAEAQRLRSLLLSATSPHEPLLVQRRALEALGPLGGEPQIRDLIAEFYESDEQPLRCSAIYAMGRSLQPAWMPDILAELENDEAELRYEAARAAGAMGSQDALPGLLAAARDDDAEVRHAAIAAIGQIGGRGGARALERLADDADEADLELIESTLEDVNSLLDPFTSA
ncbi:MAG: HEAT repeat domain-containing protein [Thermomicrobiales bacterium]|nr:HEAT repeat domain-containing protein [Thermomicrobiales bacterium]